MTLQSAPTAVNWDSMPGPDGLQLRLFLFSQGKSEAVPLERGSIDFLIYEGRVGDTEIAKSTPFHHWSFTAKELSAVGGKGMVGWSYEPQLGWGKHVPKTRTITLVVRVRQPGAPVLYSTPTLLYVTQ